MILDHNDLDMPLNELTYHVMGQPLFDIAIAERVSTVKVNLIKVIKLNINLYHLTIKNDICIFNSRGHL